jgi:murein L,D-transpeptidase YafK
MVFKDSDEFEIYAKSKTESVYSKLISYKVCGRSGQLGPKRKQGDLQVPEGFYHINRYNPTSNFHLSLGLNYPNLSDQLKSKFSNLGGDIFIHGSCVTIGCLPLTDDFIKEVYLYAIHAKNNGQSKVPVYIFPFKMTDKNFSFNKDKYKENRDLLDFWSNLKNGYDSFEKDKKELKFTIDKNGNYIFKQL